MLKTIKAMTSEIYCMTRQKVAQGNKLNFLMTGKSAMTHNLYACTETAML